MKKKLVILGAAALTVAAAVPAFAIENEFHGMYRLRAMMTNFQAAGNSPLLSNESRDFTLFEQRARLQYIAKANDDLKLVTHFEIDSSWGDAAYSNGRGIGGGLAADTVNLETKNVYLDFNVPSTPVNMKVGIQGFMDAYKGIFLFDDVAGAVATGKFGPATATAAFFRTYDSGSPNSTPSTSGNVFGKRNVDLYVLDGKFAPSKAVTVGASYYLANNDVNFSGQKTHTFGVNAAAKAGIADLDAFLIYQGGDELYKTATNTGSAKNLSAFAGQVAAKVAVGPAAVRAAVLYASGDKGKDKDNSKAYQNIFASGAAGNAPGSSTSSGVYYSSNMLILMRNIVNMDSDQSLVSSINNGNRGLQAAFVGADVKVNDKLSASVNIGHAFVDKRDMTSTAKEATTNKNIGTEFNANVNYALYPNLTATLQGGYALLGGYTKAGAVKDVKDPYLAGLMMNYTF